MNEDHSTEGDQPSVAAKVRAIAVHWRRRALWAIAVLVVLWVVAVGVEVALGVRDDSAGMRWVQQARNHTTASDVVAGTAITPLRVAETDFSAGGGWLHTPLLVPFEIVPVIGRQVRSVRDLSSAATQTARIAVSALTRSRVILKTPHGAGEARVTTIRLLAQLASSTDAQLGRINPGTGDALLSPLASKHDAFVKDLDQVRQSLHSAAAVSTAVAGLLQGPGTTLVLMGNNAEMRAGSGMFLEAGVLTTTDGALSFGHLVQTAPLALPYGQVPVQGDLVNLWGWLHPGADWRNLGLSPQFDVNAPLAARMWAADTGQHVDGVLAIDVQSLQELMQVTGPVSLPDGTLVNAYDVVTWLLHDEYDGLADTGTAQQEQIQEARASQLGALTVAVIKRLETQHLDLRELANALVACAQGRHLMMWSPQAATESAWQAGGVAGKLSSNSLLAALMNGGGNKLDQYVTVSPHLALDAHSGRTDATLTIDIANNTPPGQDQFVAGPYPGLESAYGQYLGFLGVNVPGYASRPVAAGNPKLDALGAEGPTWLIAVPVDVMAGQEQTVVIHFEIRGTHGSMQVVPSARIGPETWTYQGRQKADTAPFAINW